MNKQSKRSLAAGIVLLTLTSAVLVVYLNWSYSRVASNRGQITVSTYAVGTEYPGVITQQYVAVGSVVHAGESLFKLKSDELSAEVKDGQVDASSLTYALGKDDQMTITASKAGVVSQVSATQGSFVTADKQIAAIADSSTLGVTADFTLSTRELGQVTPSTLAIVKLPSGRQISARITSMLQSNQSGRTVTTVQASLPAGSVGPLDSAGTPVNVALVLNQSTYYHQLLGYTQSLMARWVRK
jgi:multidrug efflux pump subunit AcrA (membrane-fusion protein)